jgi:hypothetical protein
MMPVNVKTLFSNLFLMDFNFPPDGYSGVFCNYRCEKYYVDGVLHREDGPAVVWIDDKFSQKYKLKEQFWLNGKNYEFYEYWEKQKNTIYASKIMADILGKKLSNENKV